MTFIIPPSGFLLDQRVFPSLGVLKVAAVLEQASVDVDVLDLSGCEDIDYKFRAHVRKYGPADAYGVTATMPQMPAAAEIAETIRYEVPEAKLLLGGPHVTLMQASARQEQQRGDAGRACAAMCELVALFDVLVCGDGEKAISLALDEHAPAVIDGDDYKSDLFMTNAALDAAPLAARHLIDLDGYHYAIDGMRANHLIAQLGCPFQCTFCGGRRSAFLRKIRTRTTPAVIAELQHLYETYGTHAAMFFDDELNVNNQFMELLRALAELQDALGVDFRFRGFLKAELVTAEMAKAMYAVGFRQVLVGVESGHPRILENIRKQATREQNTRCVSTLQSYGISVKAAMSVGHPGESEDTIEASRQWLLDVQPDDFDVSIITVYPGTPYYDDARETTPGLWTYVDPKNGDRLHAQHVDHLRDVNFYKGVPGEYQSFVHTDYLSAAELCTLRDGLEADVRSALKIPYPTAVAVQHETSMGMGPC